MNQFDDGDNRDPIDRAARNAEMGIRSAIDRQVNRPVEAPLIIDGARCCVDCSDLITQRLSVVPNAVRCVACQGVHERQRSRLRKW